MAMLITFAIGSAAKRYRSKLITRMRSSLPLLVTNHLLSTERNTVKSGNMVTVCFFLTIEPRHDCYTYKSTVSFLRIYEAGHEVPFYQPKASLAMFQRVLEHLDIATGLEKVTADYETSGNANATHTEPYVALPSSTLMSSTTGSAIGLGFKA
jgi:hypothetical protein